MKTCSTCQYWSDRFTVKYNGVSDCGLISMGEPRDHNGTAFIAARASDDSGLDAVLLTHKDFGCTQHKEKNENTTQAEKSL
jgi:hypothetical protein